MTASEAEYRAFWSIVRDVFVLVNSRLVPHKPPALDWFALATGRGEIAYTWRIRKGKQLVYVTVDFEAKDNALNKRRLAELLRECPDLEKQMGLSMTIDSYGSFSEDIYFSIPYEGGGPDPVVAGLAASYMARLVELTINAVKELA